MDINNKVTNFSDQEELEFRDFLNINIISVFRNNFKPIAIFTLIFTFFGVYLSLIEKRYWSTSLIVNIQNQNPTLLRLNTSKKNMELNQSSPEFVPVEEYKSIRKDAFSRKNIKTLEKTLLASVINDSILNYFNENNEKYNLPPKSKNIFIKENLKLKYIPSTYLFNISFSDINQQITKDVTLAIHDSLINFSRNKFLGEVKSELQLVESNIEQSTLELEETIKKLNSLAKNKLKVDISNNQIKYPVIKNIKLEDGIDYLSLQEKLNISYEILKNSKFNKKLLEERANYIKPWEIQVKSEPILLPKKRGKFFIMVSAILGLIIGILFSLFFQKK